MFTAEHARGEAFKLNSSHIFVKISACDVKLLSLPLKICKRRCDGLVEL